MTMIPPLKLKIQILHGEEIAMGPGKAELLEAIERTGSISAAARTIGMSYRRGWMLVDVMNRCWREPLVETSAGGRRGGGARLTESGQQVLALYRGLQIQARAISGGEDWLRLQALLQPVAKS